MGAIFLNRPRWKPSGSTITAWAGRMSSASDASESASRRPFQPKSTRLLPAFLILMKTRPHDPACSLRLTHSGAKMFASGVRAMLSVVVPIYNEEENIVAFHSAIENVLHEIEEITKENWEIVYVNDGSQDASLSLLIEIHNHDPRVAVVELARNFGHQAALT